MYQTYSNKTLPLDINKLTTYCRWNHEDPPSDCEKTLNLRIEKIQGNSNTCIDESFLNCPEVCCYLIAI
jgi:endonuclease I